MKEKIIELDDFLSQELKKYGFKRQKKYTYQCKIEGGIKIISFVTTKTRGKDETHIYILAGFNYPELNKLVYFLRNEPYEKVWLTASINIGYLINPRKVYGFYINQYTDMKAVEKDILSKIVECAFPFLDKCNTLEKYESMLLSGDEAVLRSAFRRPEWNLLALSLLLERHNAEDVIEKYYDDFAKNLPLLQTAQEQIKKYDVDFKE